MPNMPLLGKLLSDEEELKKKGLIVGGLLGEGSYAKVRETKQAFLLSHVVRKHCARSQQKGFAESAVYKNALH